MSIDKNHMVWNPAPALRPYILNMFAFHQKTTQPLSMRRYPMPFVILLIELGSAIRLRTQNGNIHVVPHGGFAAGLSDTYADAEFSGVMTGIQISLTPTGARRLFGLSMDSLKNIAVPLVELLPRSYVFCLEQLHEAQTWRQRFELLEACFTPLILGRDMNTSAVDWAITEMMATRDGVNMSALCDRLGYSQKHVISLFHDKVGIPPQLMARLIRLHRTMRTIASAPHVNWVNLALSNGFYDQAHFVREIKRFSGHTPSQVRATLYGMSNILR